MQNSEFRMQNYCVCKQTLLKNGGGKRVETHAFFDWIVKNAGFVVK